MRQRFERLNIDPKHNEVHRKAYQTPYLLRTVSSAPSADDLEEYELVYCTADSKFYLNDNGTVKSSGAFS